VVGLFQIHRRDRQCIGRDGPVRMQIGQRLHRFTVRVLQVQTVEIEADLQTEHRARGEQDQRRDRDGPCVPGQHLAPARRCR